MEFNHPLPPKVFCPLLKKSPDDPNLKLLDFSQLLVADTSMIFFSPKFSLHPVQCPRALYFYLFLFRFSNTKKIKHFCIQTYIFTNLRIKTMVFMSNEFQVFGFQAVYPAIIVALLPENN